ncbi:MAG: ASCH domain-containing protein [Firmicutes bacterium]|nr:ASCH domain-containing protein [Bacillota bacterium]
MNHKMKLQPNYYNYMLNGTKRIEIRLNDEKRKQIKIGDTITFFKEPDLIESFTTKVIDLLRYDTFNDMFNNYDISILADSSISRTDVINELEKFYPIEKQNKYGVLGIKIELIQK